MLLVSSCVPVITWLCSRVMRFQSRPTNWPLLTIESPVAQWLEHPTRSWRVMGSNPIWGSDFFRVLQTFNLSCVCCFIFKLQEKLNVWRTLKKSEPQMGFEPMTLCDLVGCPNHWATGDYGEQGSIYGSWLEPHDAATQSSNDWHTWTH